MSGVVVCMLSLLLLLLGDLMDCGEGSQHPTMPVMMGRYVPGSFPLYSMTIANTRDEQEMATCVPRM